MIEPGDVQWNDEREFRLRLPGGHTETFLGANFVDGVSDAPVVARTVNRLYQAFGAALTIELWAPPPTTDTSSAVSKARAGSSVPIESKSIRKRKAAQRGERDPFLADVEPDADTEPDLPVTAAFEAPNDDGLDLLDKRELKNIALKENVRVHWNAGAGNLRRAIRDSRDRG